MWGSSLTTGDLHCTGDTACGTTATTMALHACAPCAPPSCPHVCQVSIMVQAHLTGDSYDVILTLLVCQVSIILSSHLPGVNTVNDVIAGWLLATQALITLASCSCLISLLSILVFIFIPVVERRSTATVLTFGCLITGQCCPWLPGVKVKIMQLLKC